MKLKTHIAVIPVMVTDQEEALAFYTEKLGLEKRTDMVFAPGLRLLTVAARGQKKPEIVLAKPETAPAITGERREQRAAWVFFSDDCYKAYELLTARGVQFISAPAQQFYGIEAVFTDPYGNTFMLLQASPQARSLFKDRWVGRAA